MLLLAALAVAQVPQNPGDEIFYLPGQLEVVTGLRACPDTAMGLYYYKDVAPKTENGVLYIGGAVTYSFGYVRFSTTSEEFLGWPSWHVHWTSHTQSKEIKKDVKVDATVDYWVDKTGRLHRQQMTLTGPSGTRDAVADFYPDHIDIKRHVDGKATALSLFPANDEIQQLDDQFKPMFVDGTVIVREKTFLCLDLFRGTFEKRLARISGMFDGKACDAHFHGRAVDIEIGRTKQQACVSEDNDLVKVDLQGGRTIEMTSLPSNRLKH